MQGFKKKSQPKKFHFYNIEKYLKLFEVQFKETKQAA